MEERGVREKNSYVRSSAARLKKRRYKKKNVRSWLVDGFHVFSCLCLSARARIKKRTRTRAEKE